MFKFNYPHTQTEIDANEWQEITQEEYDNLLGVLQPARQSENAFAVGEPLCQADRKGHQQTVYMICVQYMRHYYKKPGFLTPFTPSGYQAEIATQLWGKVLAEKAKCKNCGEPEQTPEGTIDLKDGLCDDCRERQEKAAIRAQDESLDHDHSMDY